MKIGICLTFLAVLYCGSLAAQGFSGTWVGEDYTYNPKRVVRAPRQTIEICGSGKDLASQLI